MSLSRDWTMRGWPLSCGRQGQSSPEECAMTDVTTTPVITQAMIDAYDEYTHLTLDRRRFMEQLSRLAGSGAAAAAIAPLLAANSAQAAIVAENDARVKGEDI